MSRLLLIASLTMLLTAACAQTEHVGALQCSIMKYGFIDKNGNWAIKPQFDGVGDRFREGLAGVEVKDKWGFIDKTGKFVIPPKFDNVESFEENLTCVQSHGKLGYIDHSGNIMIPIDLERPEQSCLQDAIALKWNDESRKYSLKDAPLTPDQFSFHEGRACVYRAGHWGYIDTYGKIVIAPRFLMARPFAGGLAMVGMPDGYRYINKAGKIIFKSARPGSNCSEGTVLLRDAHSYSFVDATGHRLTDRSFPDASPFSEGLAAVSPAKPVEVKHEQKLTDFGSEYDATFGYMDKSGRMVIPPMFHGHPDDSRSFKEGRAIVAEVPLKAASMKFIGDPRTWLNPRDDCTRYGVIDKQGHWVVKPTYDSIAPYHEGIARVTNFMGPDEISGFIDINGKEVVPLKFEELHDFSRRTCYSKRSC